MKPHSRSPRYLSLIIPLYNAEYAVGPAYERIARVLTDATFSWEIIFADDGSSDQSAARLQQLHEQDPRVRGVVVRKHVGQVPALLAGVSICRGEVLAFLDIDLQCRPEELPRLLAALTPERNAVFAFRLRRVEAVWRIAGSWLLNCFLSLRTGIRLRDWGCPLYCVRRSTVSSFAERYGRNARFLKLIAVVQQRHALAQIAIAHDPRLAGASGYRPVDLGRLAGDVLAHFSPRLGKKEGTLFEIIRVISDPERGDNA